MDHLSFVGTTGDPRPLIALLTSHYNFRPDTPDIAGEFLYLVKWNGHAMSRLRVRPAAVLSTSDPHANYEVELELSHPSSGRYLDLPPSQVAPPEQASQSVAADESEKPPWPAYKVQGPPPHASLYFVPRHMIKQKPE